MPRSKRAKVVHLSKVEKKPIKASNRASAEKIQEYATKYPYIYVLSVNNMRNQALKDVRTELSDSRLFFPKASIQRIALGSDPTKLPPPAPNTDRLAPHLTGAVGLLFSPRSPSEITAFFSSFRPLDYARAGTIATRSFTLPAGVVYSCGGEIPIEDDVPVAHSQEPNIRNWGVPTRLVRGKVELDFDYIVCKEGDVLTSGQTALLKMFGVATAEFRVGVRACWMKKGENDGEVFVLDGVRGGGGIVDGATAEEEMDADEDEFEGF